MSDGCLTIFCDQLTIVAMHCQSIANNLTLNSRVQKLQPRSQTTCYHRTPKRPKSADNNVGLSCTKFYGLHARRIYAYMGGAPEGAWGCRATSGKQIVPRVSTARRLLLRRQTCSLQKIQMMVQVKQCIDASDHQQERGIQSIVQHHIFLYYVAFH